MISSLSSQDFADLFHEIKINHTAGSIDRTYGEILFSGVEKILKKITITDHDIFLDLGSGLGKVVLQVFMQTQVCKSIGIEINPQLHNSALKIIEKFQTKYAANSTRELHLICADFLETEILAATVILIGSPCYSAKLLAKIEKKIINLEHLHTIVSLKPLLNLQNFSFKQVFKVEGSWDDALCYIYQKRII